MRLRSRICSRRTIKSPLGLFGAERIPDHMVASRRRQAGRGHGLCRLAVPDGAVDESSTIPGQFTLLMQIGNLPDEALAGAAGPRPVPARRRSGGPHLRRRAQAPVRASSSLITMRTPSRGAPGLCPRPASMPGLPFFSGWENLSWAEGILSVRFGETRDRDARASG